MRERISLDGVKNATEYRGQAFFTGLLLKTTLLSQITIKLLIIVFVKKPFL